MADNLKSSFDLFYKKSDFLLLCLIIAVVFSPLLLNGQISKVFEFDYDEGINLMKSSLFLNGFPLYKEIWNDQPPIFTLILSFWLKIFGSSPYNGRMLVMMFSMILAVVFFQTVKIYSGKIAATIALLSLLFSAAYLRLSVSVMNSVPALAFAMLSLYCLALYKKNKLKTNLAISGFFMAVSLQSKLIFAFLVPLMIVEIQSIVRKGEKDKLAQKPLLPISLWLSAFLLIYLVITAIFFWGHASQFFAQLILPNLGSGFLGTRQFGLSVLFAMLSRDYDILILAGVCLIFLLKQRDRSQFFIISWLLLAIALLFMHRPVWYHHYLLLSLPLSWLAGVGFSNILQLCRIREEVRIENRYCKDKILKKILIFAGISVLLFMPFKFARAIKSLRVESAGQDKIIAALLRFKAETHWLMTDMPIYAFYLGKLVPPELCVFSQKRIITNNLQQDLLFSYIKKYNPGQILLLRFENYNQKLIDYIEKNYTKVYEDAVYERIWYPPYRWGFDQIGGHKGPFRFFKFLFPDEGLFYQPIKYKAKVYVLKGINGLKEQ